MPAKTPPPQRKRTLVAIVAASAIAAAVCYMALRPTGVQAPSHSPSVSAGGPAGAAGAPGGGSAPGSAAGSSGTGGPHGAPGPGGPSRPSGLPGQPVSPAGPSSGAAGPGEVSGTSGTTGSPGSGGGPASGVSGTGGGGPAGARPAEALFHVGLVTQSAAQGIDIMVAVNEILAEFGHAGRGGIVRHVTTPDRFLAEMEATRDLIVSMADDPLMRAVVVFEGVPGTAEAFREIRARRPDILLFAAENHEDAELISRSADLVASQDFISRGYLVPWTARKLGADTLLHLSFPRHMTDESLYRRRVIMEKAAKDLGLRFVYEEAPDPQGEGGIEAARAYIASKFPEWLRRHGPNTAFFATNNSHTLPLIRGVIEQGGYFPEADEPSPLLGYPEALGLDPAELGQDPGRAVAMVEEALAAAGAGGRLGTWTASLAASHVKALTRFAIGIVQGKADPRDTRALLACYDASSPGVKWNGGALRDPAGREYPNVLLVYQDNYIFGSGYSGTASVKVPSKYGEMAVPTAGSGPQWDFHIAIVTGTREQGSDDHLGALEMIRRYGSSEDGGLVTHLIYPISFLNDPELTAELIASAASDPLLKAVVVNQAISGTAEGFRRIKARRPDVFCLSGEPHEDPGIITETADMVVAADYVARGYLIPYSARELGAKTLVHVTLPRHMTYFSMRQRAAVMERASAELGLGFHIEMAPDPTAPGGVEAARTFIAETLPEWLEKYGTATAFFATNDSHAEPLIAGITDLGGIFVEADIPSTLLGFPVALGVDPEPLVGDWPGLLKAVEDAAAARGAAGRLGTWAWPLGFTQTAGLTEFGRMLAEGRSDVYDVPAIIECLGLFSPGAHWAGSFLNDPATGRLVRNYLLVYQDTYILGRGYIATTKVDVPAEYFSIVPPDPPRTGAAPRLPPPGSRPGPP